MTTVTVGEALVALLEAHGVDTVFGIPGVHTVELYRGLARSRIRHVTPRHEQGAGFMADGYARASGKPGVALVITGPGLTNALTAMAQARADSIPLLVISGVNARSTLGKGMGYLHELPDQRAMMRTFASRSDRIEEPAQLPDVLSRAFCLFASRRPGPVHIEIPTDVMRLPAAVTEIRPSLADSAAPDPATVATAAALAADANRPLMLIGGGAKAAEAAVTKLAERLDAPVVTTINARGLLHRHPLAVHASPSLEAVRKLIASSDFTLAVGTEFGPTDYGMFSDDGFDLPFNCVRIDIDAEQLERRPVRLALQGNAGACAAAILAALPPSDGQAQSDGPARARKAAAAAFAELSDARKERVRIVETIRDTLPGALIVGDSTQPVYAANLCYDHDRPGGWFNAATGYGALGYAPAAAVGAAIGKPEAPVVCLTGDGGFQFTLPEIGTAVDAGTPVIFVVWNNRGYREIEESMRSAGIEPVGVSPAPPDFLKLAEAYGLPARRIGLDGDLAGALRSVRATKKPSLVEIVAP